METRIGQNGIKTKQVKVREKDGEMFLDIIVDHMNTPEHHLIINSIPLDSMEIAIEEEWSADILSAQKRVISFTFSDVTLAPKEALDYTPLTIGELEEIIGGKKI